MVDWSERSHEREVGWLVGWWRVYAWSRGREGLASGRNLPLPVTPGIMYMPLEAGCPDGDNAQPGVLRISVRGKRRPLFSVDSSRTWYTEPSTRSLAAVTAHRLSVRTEPECMGRFALGYVRLTVGELYSRYPVAWPME